MCSPDRSSSDDNDLESLLNDAIARRLPRVFDLLKSNQRHPDPEIRSTVAYGFGEISDTSSIDPLIEMVESDDSERVRDEALRALASYHDRRILDCYVREVARRKRSRPPRQVIAYQLRNYNSDLSIAALTELLEDRDEFVRSDALDSLEILRRAGRE